MGIFGVSPAIDASDEGRRLPPSLTACRRATWRRHVDGVLARRR
jgi:hypothetical protein